MLVEKLSNIQDKLFVPKDQKNDFGKYNYRTCEDILKAVKPIVKEFGCVLTMTNEIINVGGRNYVEAAVILRDMETGEEIISKAQAREEETKKGMDGSQITGASSSYARKYALNGLFLLDDTKDADTNEFHKQVQQGEKDEAEKIKEITEELKELYSKTTGKNFDKWVKDCGGISMETYPKMVATLKKQITDAAEKEKKSE